MKYFLILLSATLAGGAYGQIVNAGAIVNNTAGTFIVSSGNIANNAGGTLTGDGTYQLSGDWTNAGTFTAGASTVVFTGSTSSALTSGGGAFNNLTVQKTANAAQINLQDAATVNGVLNFNSTGGGNFLNAGANDVTVGQAGSITGAAVLAYVSTTGTGRLIKSELGSAAFIFSRWEYAV